MSRITPRRSQAMGCAIAKDVHDAQRNSRSIDRQLRSEVKSYQETIKLLLLGAGESGKSTIVKQMVILHKDGFTDDEISNFKYIVHSNVLYSMTAMIKAMKILGIQYENKKREDDATKVLRQKMNCENISPSTATSICNLWNDKGIQECFARSNEFQLIDSTEYYMNKLSEIFSPSYIPSEQDILQTRVTTCGITETRFSFKDINFLMVDVGGQRTERKKWIHCFEDVTAIIYVVGLSAYDQMLREEEEVNRMRESMALFKSICNNSWFRKTSIILFLNKIDLFRKKIKQIPLTTCFPQYRGNNVFNEASVYILKEFEDLNEHQSSKEIYSHFTCATDTKNIEIVFDAVTDVITKSNMLEIGLI